MHRIILKYATSHRVHRLSYMLITLGTLCTFFFTTVGNIQTAYADGIPGGNIADPIVRAVDIAKPAVVRIITTVSSRLTVHFSPTLDVTFPQATTQQANRSYPLTLSGSGTFISAHGDILTADHVVNPPKDDTLAQFLDQVAAPDIANYLNQNAKPGTVQVAPDQVTQQLVQGQLKSTPLYDITASEVFLNTDYTGPLTAPDFRSIPPQIHANVDAIKSESAVEQKDVAIIHVPLNDMPSVQLGDSSKVQQQDNLTIIGFPGNGDVSDQPTDLLTSSVNKISVSSIKTTNNGAPVIQVGGNVEHGDSGGPALDNSGAVVGIVSFGLASAGSSGSTSFLQASNSARDLVRTLNLDTTPGTFQKLWNQAFLDYASNTPGHWHKAQQDFQQISTNYQQFKAITPYLTYTQEQARTESTSLTSQGNPSEAALSTLMEAIGILALLALLGLVIFGVRSQQRRKMPAVANVTSWGQAQPFRHPQQPQYPQHFHTPGDDGMVAFGAPPRGPAPIQSMPNLPPRTIEWRAWNCGHINRSDARYCGTCGEPSPWPPKTRPVEQ